MKKIINLFLAMVIAGTMMPLVTFANEEVKPLAMLSDVGTVDLNLDGLVLTTEYHPFEIRAVKMDHDEIYILDAQNGEMKEIIHFYEEVSTYNYSQFFVLRDKYDGPVKTTVEVVLELWSSGSFRQINRVLSHKIFASGNSSTTLEDKSTQVSSQTGAYPTSGVNISGSGVITQVTTTLTSGSFSLSALQSAGFTVSSSSGTTRYLRKYTAVTGSYRVY
ncbi:MAG: hypothetical protein ACRDD4_10120 [Culicoidibacterales bacterium]